MTMTIFLELRFTGQSHAHVRNVSISPTFATMFAMVYSCISFIFFSVLINKDVIPSRFVSQLCGQGSSLANTLNFRGALVSGYCGFKSAAILTLCLVDCQYLSFFFKSHFYQTVTSISLSHAKTANVELLTTSHFVIYSCAKKLRDP